MSERRPGHEPEEPPGRKQARKVARQKAERDLDRLEKEIEEVEAYRMPLMEHLIELKDRLIRALVALTIGCGIGFWQAKPIYAFLTAPFVEAMSETEGVSGGLALVHGPFEGVFTYLKVSLIAGLMVALPVIVWQVWAFVAPGLYQSERRVVAPLTLSSVVLFVGGAAFCYYALFPFAFPFFLQVLEEHVSISVSDYLSSIIQMIVAFGVSFQLPVAVFFLARMGAVDARDMLSSFRYAIVVIFLVAAFLTPPDPITQALLAAPLTVLYGVGIIVAAIFSTKVRTQEGDG